MHPCTIARFGDLQGLVMAKSSEPVTSVAISVFPGAGMGYGHGLRLNRPDGEPRKSKFVAEIWVTYKTGDGRQVRGQVVGPDQDYFPAPDFVFVSFSSGFAHLLPVGDLELTEGDEP